MTPTTLAGQLIIPSLGVMKPLKYDHAVWQKIKADWNHAMVNPSASRPNWMIGRPCSLTAFMEGYTYVLYRETVPLRPMTYGTAADIDISLNPFVRVMLDMHVYALAHRPPFVAGQGAIRAVKFTDAIDYVLSATKTPSPTRAP